MKSPTQPLLTIVKLEIDIYKLDYVFSENMLLWYSLTGRN